MNFGRSLIMQSFFKMPDSRRISAGLVSLGLLTLSALYFSAQADMIDNAVSVLFYGREDGLKNIDRKGLCIYNLRNKEATIDFNEVAEIKVQAIGNMSAELDATLNKKPVELNAVSVVVLGSDHAVCERQGCVGKRAFVVDDLAQLERMRRAASYIRQHTCPGLPF